MAAAPLVTELANLEHQAEVLPEGVDLLDTFLEINVAETTALLHMVAAMSPDEGLRSRAQVGLTARRQPMPPQVSGLAQASVAEAVAFSDGAGENLMVELVLPRGVRAVLISYIPWSPSPSAPGRGKTPDDLHYQSIVRIPATASRSSTPCCRCRGRGRPTAPAAARAHRR